MMKKMYPLLVPVGIVLFFSMHESHAAKKTDLLANGMQLSDQWDITDGVLSPSEKPGGIIWSKNVFEDFEIFIEYKTSPKCNSGLFFRTDPKNPVQGGFEVQIASPGLYSGKHVAGSLYDAKEPAVHAGKPDGEWNTMSLTCKGAQITVVLNGVTVIEDAMLPDVPAQGPIGLQSHGSGVTFSNILIRKR